VDNAVEARELRKRYGRTAAVDGLSLTVRDGEVYGLVGPNGAGKTTLFRLILGLVRPDGGQARIFGASAGSAEALRRTAGIVESPAYYPFLSGRDNLRVLADYGGIARSRIAEALERVGLTDRAGDPAGRYSVGMRQRLALAGAFMKAPDLYMLDEPTNGLDPGHIGDARGDPATRRRRRHRAALQPSAGRGGAGL
jgi:ABC-2 type transport system ATP-binding protein